MKKITIVLIFLSNILIAQDFQGVATYKTHRKLDIKLDSTQMNSDMQKQIYAMMKKQFEKTYLLSFNKNESNYKEKVNLESPQSGPAQIIMIGGGGSTDELYKNRKENRFTNQNDMFGKLFLIKDQLQNHEWKLESETKNIGNYTCYKATKTIIRDKIEDRFNSDGDKQKNEKKENTETIVVTAWYTTQIPVSFGPREYDGLPGLILEINDGSETLICSKIVLNPKKEIHVNEPQKGKVVTQEKHDEIMLVKMKEMENRYRSNDRNGGENIEIRIGG